MITSNNESISEILKSIDEGKTQLPDFQRGWVWEWKNQSIIIKCYPKWSRTTILYQNCGYEQRMKNEASSKAAAEKAVQDKNQAIQEAKAKQQI